MKYYIIAGEASGDLHGANLINELKKTDPQAIFRCWGGDLMEEQGAEIVKHYRDLAFMGFFEVVTNLRTIIKNIDFCKSDLLNFNPDAVILVDYPGFNLRIAEFAHDKNYKVIYYISPQVWAWKQSRVKKIKRVVDKMLVILPFEQDFYKRFNYEVEFVGHPLLDAISRREKMEDDFLQKHHLDGKKIIALLPGSRKQEIKTMLPLMINAVKSFTDYTIVIAGAPSILPEFYEDITEGKIKTIFNATYEILQHAEAALVTSGTATLETALFGVPQVVCYKGNRISYLIAKQLIKIDFISLVNLVMKKEIVKELIQDDLNAENIKSELKNILSTGSSRVKILQGYQELKEALGGSGASERAAISIHHYLNPST
ncbi:MAG: lipid-A-disaccharide synthase [Bacteroidota bacterium]